MKTRRFDFNWKPLQLQVAFYVEGSVPDKQSYNADIDEYTPDYALTPLVIQPAVSVIDRDEVIADGRINHALTNIKWYEIAGGVKTLIDSDNDSYEITAAGGFAGRIIVKKNASQDTPLTLVFYAEYIDPRNSQLITVQGSYLILCNNASSAVRVELDAAEQTVYNPLSDARAQVVTAKVWLGDAPCPADRYALTWEVAGEDGSWHQAGMDDVLDYFIAVSGNSVTIDKWLMGERMSLRCRVRYSADGNPGDIELGASSPEATASFIRRIPAFEFDVAGVPYNIPAGILRISPSATIRTNKREIEDPEKELLPLWFIATNKASGSLSYTLVAHGVTAAIPTSAMDADLGGDVGLDVIDRGFAGALLDASDGSIVSDSNGDIIIIH